MPVLKAKEVAATLRRGGSARMPVKLNRKFKTGDSVRVRNINPAGHTRLPRYLRGRKGVIERDQGVFIFPDTHAATGEKIPHRLYCVKFSAGEVWGKDNANQNETIYADLFESYLEQIR